MAETTIDELFPPLESPSEPTEPPLAVYCPKCSAYIFAGFWGDGECDQCGCEFVIEPLDEAAAT